MNVRNKRVGSRRGRRSRVVGLVALLAAVSGGGAAAQEVGPGARVTAAYDSVYFAWEHGAYVDALERAERLLGGPDAEVVRRPLALLTGELFHTAEVAPEGVRLGWSPDGRFASYETGEGDEATIHLLRVETGGVTESVALTGWDANFLGDGRSLVYFRLPNHAALNEAREAERAAAAVGDEVAVQRHRAEISVFEAQQRGIVVRSLEDGTERLLPAEGLERYDLAAVGDGSVVLVGRRPGESDRYDLFLLREGEEPRRLSRGPGMKGGRILGLGPDRIVYTLGTDRVAVQRLNGGSARIFEGRDPVVSRDGSTVAFVRTVPVQAEARRGAGLTGADLLSGGGLNQILVLNVAGDDEPRVVKSTTLPLASPALSPSGGTLAFTSVPRDDWEIFTLDLTTGEERRVTREIQHDLFPAFLAEDALFAVMGEARHRRAYLHPLTPDPGAHATGDDQRGRIRLFHNNTLRTVAPQYEWVPSPDGTKLLVVADRDGDTLSPERGIYLVDLGREVTLDELTARIRAQLEGERRLREWGVHAFAGIETEVRAATEAVDVSRIYDHAHALYQFGSKYITQPGNARAIEYLAAALRDMGYEPELEWFEPRPGVRTANVVATLPGTLRPDRIHVISSHFDSVEPSPGADDNSSGTTALLEAARVLATRPQPETIRFAFLTGEEAGLLGAREHVRLAVARGDRIASVLNNDMVGWSGGRRLDNTIRYSNDTIRDLQHSAAILFTDLITYDARYVRSTDAQAFWDAYGDIVGGIGSYPILGNPHYHQAHDTLEVVDYRLVGEVAKTTVAAAMWLSNFEF